MVQQRNCNPRKIKPNKALCIETKRNYGLFELILAIPVLYRPSMALCNIELYVQFQIKKRDNVTIDCCVTITICLMLYQMLL